MRIVEITVRTKDGIISKRSCDCDYEDRESLITEEEEKGNTVIMTLSKDK